MNAAVLDIFLIVIFLFEHFIYWGKSCGWGEYSILAELLNFGGGGRVGGGSNPYLDCLTWGSL